jgi:hypothetical protein
MKRKEQQAEAAAWMETREAEVSRARQFLYGLGDTASRSGRPRLLFAIGEVARAGLTTFLDQLQSKIERKVRISCRDDDARDPLYEGLFAAVWHLLLTKPGAEARFCDALHTFTSLANVPSPDDVRRMITVGAAGEAPRRLRLFVPEDFEELRDVLAFVAGEGAAPLRVFIDDAIVTARNRTLEGAIRSPKPARLEVAIGMRWTTEAVQLVDRWRRTSTADLAVVKLNRLPSHGLPDRSQRRDAFRDLFFPVVRGDGTAREQWNEEAIALIVKIIAALDGIAAEDVEHVATLLQTQDEALSKLLADYDVLQSEAGEVRVTPAWTNAGSCGVLIQFVEEVLASGTSNPVAELVVKIARRDAKRSHQDPLASARALLLAIVARYVRSSNSSDQSETATSATLLARYLEQNVSRPSDRHFAILDDLYRDSDNLSIIDYGLSLVAAGGDEPSFEELRFFRSACRAARRYADRQISTEASAHAAGERLRPWVVPAELALLGNALFSIWQEDEVKAWIKRFSDRLGEFGLTPATLIPLCRQDVVLDERHRVAFGRSERKSRQAARRTHA